MLLNSELIGLVFFCIESNEPKNKIKRIRSLKNLKERKKFLVLIEFN